MSTFLSPLQLLSVALAGWMYRYQHIIIDYLVAENQLLQEQLAWESARCGYKRMVGALSNPGFTVSARAVRNILVARQLTDEFDGPLRFRGYLIMNRDHKFTPPLKALMRREVIEPVRCPPRSPNCNASAERFVRSVKEDEDAFINAVVIDTKNPYRVTPVNWKAWVDKDEIRQVRVTRKTLGDLLKLVQIEIKDSHYPKL